jgi:hypothetical protein
MRREKQGPIDESEQLRDQSKLLEKRSRRLQRASEERIARLPHSWERIAVGRVCSTCLATQADDEFDDNVPCRAS